MGLFEGLSTPARQLLIRATEAAAAMEGREVDGAHLLIGFLDLDQTKAGGLLGEVLTDRPRLNREVQRVTITGARTQRPMFSQDVALVLAAAHGVAVARRRSTAGTAACLIGLLTILPRGVEEIFLSFTVDLASFRQAALDLNDDDEPTGSTSEETKPWAVFTGASGRFAWSDEPTA